MRNRRRYFSLLEVLIALGLTLMIFTMLLGAYFEAERSALLWKKEEEVLFPERFVQHRLEEVFRHLIEVDQSKSFFYSTTLGNFPSLVFSYNNGIIFDPSLSGNVLGRLFVDPKGNLTLITWPEKEKWSADGIPSSFHREILMPHVTQISLEFFQLSEDDSAQPSWKLDWSKDLKFLPAVIKMKIQSETDQIRTHHFIFPIPQIIGIIKP